MGEFPVSPIKLRNGFGGPDTSGEENYEEEVERFVLGNVSLCLLSYRGRVKVV